jgi:hypothetical protein
VGVYVPRFAAAGVQVRPARAWQGVFGFVLLLCRLIDV